jgi:hypothetical protein
MAVVLKTTEAKVSGGSNPSPSAPGVSTDERPPTSGNAVLGGWFASGAVVCPS